MSRSDRSHTNTDGISQREAAERIQRIWRSRNRANSKKYMTADARWKDALLTVEMEASDIGAQREGGSGAKTRWRRAAVTTQRLHDGNSMLRNEGLDVPGAAHKRLETQHWLELVDGKHRYGSNLKYYFKRWKDSDTEDNFFKWLDRGNGKKLSLKECPREQLEKERIVYLSAEQRLNYLVNIDSDGKLRWARNDHLVDTSAGHWKDAGRDEGIVPLDAPDAPERRGSNTSALSPVSSSLSSVEENAVAHYFGPQKGKYRLTRALRSHLTIHGIIDKLLRKTLRRNTWIYVSDVNFNLFVGIKEPGAFQHSSFLSGGLVTSAGLISVKEGMIHTLSPLSGHYRTSIDHFRSFLKALERRGVNMEKVEKSKAETALWLIEHLAKLKKHQSELFSRGKNKAKSTMEEAGGFGDAVVSGSWKRDILEGRKKQKPEGKTKETHISQDIEKQEKREEQRGETVEWPISGDPPESDVQTREKHNVDNSSLA